MNQEDSDKNEKTFSLELQHSRLEDDPADHYTNEKKSSKDEKETLAKIKKILYQENATDDELIVHLLTFFENNKEQINSQIIRNTFALVMSLYGIDSVDDLKRSMESAYDEGPSQRLAQKMNKSKNEILQLFEKNKKTFANEKNQNVLEQILKNLVFFSVDTAPYLNEDKDLSLRYKIVTGFIGKILGHMGQFQIDMLLELIRWLFPELDEKTAQIFGSDIWFHANGTFKKKF